MSCGDLPSLMFNGCSAGTGGARSAKKYIWQNLSIERHDSATPDMDDTEAPLSFRLSAPKRTCICAPRLAGQVATIRVLQ